MESDFCAVFSYLFIDKELMMMNIVFLDRTALPSHIDIPRPSFPHTWQEYARTSQEEIISRAQDAEIIITSKVLLTADILQQLPKLKLIAITATGTNNVDLVAAEKLGIAVKNVAGYSTVTVPEHVIGFIFALKHRLMDWYHDQMQGKWAESAQFCYFDYPILDVQGSVLGVVGKGDIGKEVGRLAQALGMQVIYAERYGAKNVREGYLPFEEVLQKADILTLHCPLTAETENLINAETLKLMKPGALLINTGRGQLIDEEALVSALEKGTLAGAAIDVLRQEPPQKENVLLNAGRKLPNLLITPHIAWASDSAVRTLVNKVRQNLEDFVANQA